jgi:hypothetical protein
VLAFLGLAFSTWAADFGSTMAHHAVALHAATTAIVMAFLLMASGLLWLGKFAILNVLLFTERPSPRRATSNRRLNRPPGDHLANDPAVSRGRP